MGLKLTEAAPAAVVASVNHTAKEAPPNNIKSNFVIYYIFCIFLIQCTDIYMYLLKQQLLCMESLQKVGDSKHMSLKIGDSKQFQA